MQKLCNVLLNNPWSKEEMKRQIKKHFEVNENKSTICHILQDITEAVLSKKEIIAINTNIRKERSQIHDFSFYLKKLEKEKQIKPKARRKNNYVRAKTNELENRKIIEKINKTKSWFFKKINREDTNNIRNLKDDTL